MSPKKIRTAALAVSVILAFSMFSVMKGRLADGEASADTLSGTDSLTAVPDSAAMADSVKALQVAADSAAAAVADSAQSSTAVYRAGEDPGYAAKMGWPVNGPAALSGALLPQKRIIAYYGNPLSKRMGVLGEYEKSDMLNRLDRTVAAWREADPATPVVPAMHLVAVVAAGEPGPSGKWRTIMRDTLIEQVYGWAKEKDGILFIDIQVGHSDIRELLPKFEKFLMRPDVHLGVDPEFYMQEGIKPGAKIGTMDASDINYVTQYLADLVKKHNLPPKVLTVHRFTRNMVTNSAQIKLRPEVQVVMHMDGWGAAWLKRDSYKDYIVKEPVQYTGFKLFYHNDTKKGDPLMSPSEVLKLNPKPLYIQYQ